MKEIGKRIKEIRIENKLSQKQFGETLSVSQDTVSLWENGKSLPTAEFVIAICRRFQVSADYRIAKGTGLVGLKGILEKTSDIPRSFLLREGFI